MRRFGLLAVAILSLAPSSAFAQAVSVSPTCGTVDTHFILSVGGWSTCPDLDDNIHNGTFSVFIDGQHVYGISNTFGARCLSGFSVDLHEVFPPGSPHCATCNLTPGPHTIVVVGVCERGGGSPSCRKEACRQTTIEIFATLPDPWANDLDIDTTTVSGLDSMTITSNPPSGCGVPDCNEVYLIQSARILAIAGTDSLCLATELVGFAYGSAGIDSLKATVTPPPACTFIDHIPGDFDPYMNGRDKSDRGNSGRSGANASPSTTNDTPNLLVPAGASSVLIEFEVNAYCGRGKTKGTYLGKTFWLYERVASAMKGRIRRDPRRGPDLGGPTEMFRMADSLYRKVRGFPPAKPSLPSKGGVSCP